MTPPKLPPPQLITTPDTLAILVAELKRAERYALDTESNSLYAYYHRVCLIQISTPQTDYIIDTITL
ncbi:MAG: hypothetical protein J5I90_21215, partial [Caldilineales bacterium]|nr:hypothetical protein [Caldilineales bacterium]